MNHYPHFAEYLRMVRGAFEHTRNGGTVRTHWCNPWMNAEGWRLEFQEALDRRINVKAGLRADGARKRNLARCLVARACTTRLTRVSRTVPRSAVNGARRASARRTDASGIATGRSARGETRERRETVCSIAFASVGSRRWKTMEARARLGHLQSWMED